MTLVIVGAVLMMLALPVIAALASERFASRRFGPTPGIAVVLALGGFALLVYLSR